MEARYKRYHILTKCNRCVLILTTLLWFTSAVSRAETTTTLQEGVEYVKLRLYPQAADAFKSILSQQPTNVDALFQLANVYKLQDDLELAIETFNKIFPAVADLKNASVKARIYGLTHLALAEIYCKQSQLDIAEQHAKEAVQNAPTDADTHYRLGYIYTHQARFDAALAAFKRTLARNPDFSEVYEWLGLIALMRNEPKQAVAHYRTAIEKKPYVQSAYYNLAKAYRLLGDMPAAREQLKLFHQMKTYYDRTYAIESALTEDPVNATLRSELADIHLEHKHISAAIATYQTLIRLNPDRTIGYDKLARLYMNLNAPQRAIPLFEKILELDPDTVEAHVRLGWLYTQLKAFDKAEVHLQAAIKKMPNLSLAYHGLAEIYTQQGQLQKAIDTYRHITKIEPDDSDAWKALNKLERLKQESQTTR